MKKFNFLKYPLILPLLFSSMLLRAEEPTNKEGCASIAVAKVEVKAPKYKRVDPEGAALEDMIITALFKTNKFLIYEKEILEELEEERELGKVEEEYKAADIMLKCSITGFEPETAGKAITGGFCLPFLFAGGGVKEEKAYIALDIRLIDTRNRTIIGAKHITGEPGRKSYGITGFGWANAFAAGGSFSGYKNTPIEEAIYDLLDKLANYCVNTIPPSYFKY
jgi:curli biogenesis system outer membrane secretion channel CsgG